jgi:all-trans-8'-apo-beta-carotenal 15,15'-oxygenase
VTSSTLGGIALGQHQQAAPWQRLFQTLPREHGFEDLTIRGHIPNDLSGLLVRNGPANFESQGQPYGHIFDADGGITAIQIKDGGAKGACRIVQSEALVSENRKGQHSLYPGFATKSSLYAFKLLIGQMRNPANTNIIHWNNKLLALFEAGCPTEIDEDSLSTLGVTKLGGVLKSAFSAHPHVVPERKTLYNFAVEPGPKPRLELFAWPEKQGIKRLCSLPLPGRLWLHDFMVTQNFAVFFVPPIRVQPSAILLGRKTVSQILHWDPNQGTEVIIIPLDAPHTPIRFHVDPFYQWHFANAYETDKRRIVVDLVKYRDFQSFHWLDAITRGPTNIEAPGYLSRAIIDPCQSLSWRRLSEQPAEFPRVAPGFQGRDYQYVYFTAHKDLQATKNGLQDRLVKLDLKSGQEEIFIAANGEYVGEPIFVPRSGPTQEDHGYLLSMIYSSTNDQSRLAIFDAQKLSAGPIGEALFDHRIPMSFHGSWIPK